MHLHHRTDVEFDVVLERDETGAIIADVPVLPGCHSAGRTKKEAMANIREAIALYLEVKGPPANQVIGFERISVPG